MNKYAQRFKTTEARFWEKADKTGDCWLWTSGQNNFGYGQFRLEGRTRAAHRVAWELTHGPIPKGMCVLHVCDVRNCVRPDHLFLGTHKDNTQDMLKKGRRDVRGERNGAAQLCELDVWLIRNIEGQTNKAIAEFLDLSQQQVGKIRNHKIWRHV